MRRSIARGKMDEMVAVAAAVPAMSDEGEARLARAMATTLREPDGVTSPTP